MKKGTLALILILVLCVFAFASCDKGKKGSTTAADTAPAGTTAYTPDGTTAHVHTPASEYTIDDEPTCMYAGSKSKHCTVCDEIIPETVEEIPQLDHTPDTEITVFDEATCTDTGLQGYVCLVCGDTIEDTLEVIQVNPNAHKVEEWSATPTVLNPSVHATGECTLCHKMLEEDRDFVPAVVNSVKLTSSYSISKQAEEIRGDKHFYPTDEDIDGNDLWFEYSFLWNPSYANWTGLSEMEVAGLWSPSNSYANHRPLYYFYATDNPGKDCPFGGHFDYSAYMPGLSPSWSCAVDPGNGQPIYHAGWASPITENDSPAIGEYGWHRLGVHFHQEVVEYSEEKGGTVYSGYHELFIDGVKVWVIRTNMQGNWKNGKWNNADKSLKGTESLLWTAEYDGANWTYTENNVYVKAEFASSLRSSAQSIYVVIDDPIWTCGDGFALNVEPVTNPVETMITLAEGVEVPGTIFFKLAD